jgi:phosphatidate cytidylyltransferase
VFRDRVISSILWILFLWLVIFVLPEWFFSAVTVCIIALALYEFFNMVSKKGILVYRYFGIIIGCLIPITTYIQFQPTAETEFMMITAVCLAVFLLQFTRRRTEHALAGIATTIFAIFYISWFFSFIIKLRIMSPPGFDGRFLVLYLLIVTKSGDMAAYLFGSLFGKHHFMKKISPKKSVEGLIGAFVVSLAMAVLFRGFLNSVHILHVCIIGIMLGSVGQLGDLSESLIKRDCQLKDSSNLFPGLGGMLDLIDSLLFTTPVFFFYIRLLAHG